MRITTLVLTTLCMAPLTAVAHAPEECTPAAVPAPQSYATHIQLTEVYPAPTTDEEEYVVLENTEPEPVDLAGWSIADASAKKYTITADDFVSTTLAGHGRFNIPFSVSKIYLNNSADSVLLYQPDGTLLDQTSYDAAEKGALWERTSNGWQWAGAETEPEKETTTKPQESSAHILLSELLPDPTGPDSTDEWIEITNTGTTSVYLDGWEVTDGSRYYSIESVTIRRGEYLLFDIGETGINLNNTGDTVYLVDPFGKVINGTTYENSTEGESWARFGEVWEWTNAITPGQENEPRQDADAPSDSPDESREETPTDNSVSVAHLRAQEDGSTAAIEGVVTVLPGVLGSQYFYIQDDSAGIQVYSYRKDFPDLETGDRVRITGEKSTSRGEARIKTTTQEDMYVVSSGNEYAVIEVSELEESLEGMVVRVQGLITEKSSTNITVDDAVQISLKASANIDKALFEEGKAVSVTGVVTESDGEYKLLPRSNEDVEAGTTDAQVPFVNAAAASNLQPTALETAPRNSKDQTTTLLIILVAGLGAALIGMVVQQKKKRPHTNGSGPRQPSRVATIFDEVKKSR